MNIEQTVKENHMILLFLLLAFIGLYSFGNGVIFEKNLPVWVIYLALAGIYGIFHILKKDLLSLQDRVQKMMSYYQNQKVEKQLSQPTMQQQQPSNPFDADMNFRGMKQ